MEKQTNSTVQKSYSFRLVVGAGRVYAYTQRGRLLGSISPDGELHLPAAPFNRSGRHVVRSMASSGSLRMFGELLAAAEALKCLVAAVGMLVPAVAAEVSPTEEQVRSWLFELRRAGWNVGKDPEVPGAYVVDFGNGRLGLRPGGPGWQVWDYAANGAPASAESIDQLVHRFKYYAHALMSADIGDPAKPARPAHVHLVAEQPASNLARIAARMDRDLCADCGGERGNHGGMVGCVRFVELGVSP